MWWTAIGVAAAAAVKAKAAHDSAKKQNDDKAKYDAERICAYCGTKNDREFCPSCGAPQPKRSCIDPYSMRISPIYGVKMLLPENTAQFFDVRTRTWIRKGQDGKIKHHSDEQMQDNASNFHSTGYSSQQEWAASQSSSSNDSYSGGGGTFDGGGASGDYSPSPSCDSGSNDAGSSGSSDSGCSSSSSD